MNASALGPVRLSLTHVRGVAQEDAEPEGYEDELSEWAHYLHTFADDEAEESSDEPEDEPVTPVASPKGSPKREKFNKPAPAHTFKKLSLDGRRQESLGIAAIDNKDLSCLLELVTA